MRKEVKEKVVASFELTLVIMSVFAFSYLISESNDSFSALSSQELEKVNKVKLIKDMILKKITTPMIPVVSAAEEIGCCALDNDGVKCSTTTESYCQSGFNAGVDCDNMASCQVGCCYNSDQGIFDAGVYESDCTSEDWDWASSSDCNLPGATSGCCVFDGEATLLTEGQCKIQSAARGIESYDWEKGLTDIQCMLISSYDDYGACYDDDGACEMTTMELCSENFASGYLCTAESLNTSCKRTENTDCVDGADQVYFIDSCGEPANIYDSSKVDDDFYWTYVVAAEDSCNSDSTDGSANDDSCGNCNRFLGGMCSSASEDDFDVDYGDYYCKETGCYDDTDGDGVKEHVKNGESWCVYDGTIGDGNDPVGSIYAKKTCSYGVVSITSCGDYRNKICAQSNTLDDDDVVWRSASCITNNWKECISLNEDEDSLSECNDAPHCMVEQITVSDPYFSFDVCVPKYPAGFDLTGDDSDYEEAETLCGIATVECYIAYERQGGFLGIGSSCEVAEDEDGNEINPECEDAAFPEQMNDLCRKLGDCGLEVNYLGKYTSDGYDLYGEDQGKTSTSWVDSEKPGTFSQMSSSYKTGLKNYANLVVGQTTDEEDLQKIIARSTWGVSTGDTEEALNSTLFTNPIFIGSGVVALTGYLVAAIGTHALLPGAVMEGLGGVYGAGESLFGLGPGMAGAGIGPAVTVIAGFAAGAAIGAMGALYVADMLGLDSYSSTIMMAGGAFLGGAAAIAMMTAATNGWNIVGWIAAAIGTILVIISLSQSECEDYVVTYECKPWEPPIGGDDCSLCNDEELCTEYKCESLGTACQFLNTGTDYEMCEAIADDGVPPMLSAAEDLSENVTYEDISDSGFTLKPESGAECFDAYQSISIGLESSEAAKCKYSSNPIINFDDDSETTSFGVGAYVTDHVLSYTTINPTHGMAVLPSLYDDGNFEFYVKCEDVYGYVTPTTYQISFCVEQGPDTNGPVINKIDPEDGSLVSYEKTNKTVNVYTNELSDCRWSVSDVSFENMENNMTRVNTFSNPSIYGYWSMTTIPTEDNENTIYIDCMDQPWLAGTENESSRNSMSSNVEYTLEKPSAPIAITSILPNDEFESATSLTNVTLKVKTSNGGKYHTCSMSLSGYDSTFIMQDTGIVGTHTQLLNLAAGKKTVYVECEDETGDKVQNETSFTIRYDGASPTVTRIWQDNSDINLITDEVAECRYSMESCIFDFKDGTYIGYGTEMSTSVIKGETYYIKCADDYGNMPSGRSCSVKIVAT